jgi:hypothetical protein
MRIELISQPDMKLLTLTKKIINNPWIGVTISLVAIIISLYKILDDITVMRFEYIVLVLAFPIYIKSLKKIFDDILDTSEDYLD